MSIADKLVQIAENQSKVYNAGYEKGKAEGSDSYYNAFWDAFQQNGTRKSYICAFYGEGWTIENFKPKYSFIGSMSFDSTFRNSKIEGDMVEIADRCGIIFDFSDVYNITQCFRSSRFTRLGELILNHNNLNSFNYVFDGMTLLETIDNLTIKDTGNVTFTNAFTNCTSLKNITFGGVIGRDISFAYSSLTPASMKSVIEHLANYSGTKNAYKYTVTFTDDCWAALEADSTAPTGTTWAEYVDSLGWNT